MPIVLFSNHRRQKNTLRSFITPNDLAKEIDVNAIEADYIFLSHGHADHVADCVDIAKRTGAKV
jgi:L-ascorbate metabolism protein UlaG (beta-lactamase superfamily)